MNSDVVILTGSMPAFVNVAHATGLGMDWLAVSDVGTDVLSAFVQRLAREVTSGRAVESPILEAVFAIL
ncbi:MAG: hypothetical protein H0T80_05145 [Betaproteobacteria bacterium]|nr:hypothetical protein [Betaproteobacteria bacterium]